MSLEQQLRETIGQAYRVERELGGGGMSRVFVAEELALQRKVALKVLTADFEGGVSADRFRREILTVANLQHPHIVPLLSAGSAGSAVYYTMPLVEGESLRERLARDGRLRVRHALLLTREVVEALAYAHRHGVIHRDIKPENVLLTDGHAVVADFGVAKALTASAVTATTLTQAGMAIGTPAYMAPEQVLADPAADHRVDLYAAGCLLHEMLSGRPPFSGATLQEILHAQITRPPPDLGTVRADVSADVAAWVRRALAKTPDERWPDADEALGSLDACLDRLSGERTAGTAPAARRRGLLVAGALLAVAAAASVRFLRPGGTPALDPNRIGILPFMPADPTDTALARLGRYLAITLTANLEDVRQFRLIDPQSILAQLSAGGAHPPDQQLALVRRLGGGRALMGTLARTGGLVRIDYRLLATDGDGRPVVSGHHTSASGDGAIVALTDSTSWNVLDAVLPANLVSTRSVSDLTKSIPALRAYLDGEELLLANEWVAAEAAYARAIEADSTFWFAYRRINQAANWMLSNRRNHEGNVANQHRATFPERERLMMESNDSGGFDVRLARLAEVTRRFPDYWYGWFTYADVLMHDGYRLGIPPAESHAAFDRALELNPGLMPVHDHALLEGLDSTRAEQAWRTLRNHYGAAWDTITHATGSRVRTLFGVQVSRIRDGRIAPDLLDALADEAARRHLESSTAPFVLGMPTLLSDPHGQLDLERGIAQREAPRSYRTPLRLWSASAWATRGAWDSALVAFDEARGSPTMLLAAERYALATLGYWTGGSSRQAALDRRAALASYASDTGSSGIVAATALAFLDGMVAYTERRTDGIDSARTRLRRISNSVNARILERSLTALQLELSGNRQAAADSLVRQEWERAGARGWVSYPVPFLRLAAGRWAGEAGHAARADSLLMFHQVSSTTASTQRLLRSVSGLAAFERARAWEKAGDAARATKYYRDFLRLYDRPPAEHAPLVTQADSALARLSGLDDRPRRP